MKWNKNYSLHLILIILSTLIIISADSIGEAAEVTSDGPKVPTFLFLLLEDNDCDGIIQSCYSGPQGTLGVGECTSGTETCTAGAWSACNGEILPTDETCDGADNDCDGIVDGMVQSCYSGPQDTLGVGECIGGTSTCTAGAWGDCVGEILPTDETCDGADNDCDGQTDEGFILDGIANVDDGKMLGETCGVGACEGGVVSCSPDDTTAICDTEYLASSETCNDLDDDCDGSVDEGNPGGGGACDTGQQGVCAAGTNNCVSGALICTANTSPSVETCNGLDDDCDGIVDEGNPGGGEACYTDQYNGTDVFGACQQGTTTCGGGVLVCTPGSPTTEVCNGIDDDCDGVVDEDFKLNGKYVSDDNCGVCGNSCDGAIQNGTAICDGTLAQPICVVSQCDPGYMQLNAIQCIIDPCDPNPCTNPPDSVDFDEDGAVYLSYNNSGTCEIVGEGVICDYGATLVDCNDDDPNNFPGNAEVCDGSDNDCDELVDECTNAVAGIPPNEDFSSWQPNDSPTASGFNSWYCNATLSITEGGVLTGWELYVNSGGAPGEIAQIAVIRCSSGSGGTGPALEGCVRVGVGPSEFIFGNGSYSFSLAGSTQLDGSAPDTDGIVVQTGDYICADSNDYSIGGDCNGSAVVGGCPGNDFDTQYISNLDTIEEPFTLLDSNVDATLMIRASGTTCCN